MNKVLLIGHWNTVWISRYQRWSDSNGMSGQFAPDYTLVGCYALKTDLPTDAASAETLHYRYKDLALVEQGFQTVKTDYLKVRLVFVRNEAHTRGHVLVVMLASR